MFKNADFRYSDRLSISDERRALSPPVRLSMLAVDQTADRLGCRLQRSGEPFLSVLQQAGQDVPEGRDVYCNVVAWLSRRRIARIAVTYVLGVLAPVEH